MALFNAAVSALILVGIVALVWQLGPQGARGERVPIAILTLICLGYLLLTPPAEAALESVRVNAAYLASHLCSLSAIVLTTQYWRHHLSADPRPSPRRALAARVTYGCVAVILVALFATSPQQPHGLGFGREFAGSPGMQLYWMVQAVVMIHAMSTLALVAGRASARERRWRRGLLALLSGVAVVFTVYEVWVIVVVVEWPDMPPPWAQRLTATIQILGSVLLVAGTIGPAVSGVLRSTRLARTYLEQLAPLHHWLTRRYPQVRFRTRLSLRAETRVTDMLIEISDALRLLQRDAPALAAAHGLGDDTIRATVRGSSHHAAYELTAARLFRAAADHPVQH